VIDGLTIDRLGALHGVHETTAYRRVRDARARLVRLVRQHLVKSLGVNEGLGIPTGSRPGAGARRAVPLGSARGAGPGAPSAAAEKKPPNAEKNYSLTPPEGDPREKLAAIFVKPLPPWLREGDDEPGGLKDMVASYGNIDLAAGLLERSFADYFNVCRARGRFPNLREIVAVRLVTYGARQLYAAHAMHLRDEPFYQVSAMSLTRTAIELVGRGGWAAIGSGKEPEQVVYGPRLPNEKDRRVHEVNTTECMRSIERKALRAWPEADPPLAVYKWLNQFTHFDGRVVDLLGSDDRKGLRTMAYSATAYVAWLAAAMAGVILGRETVAHAPRLPTAVPWRP
jgi:hypothetical protein